MKVSRTTLAVATILGVGTSSGAIALDLYVDTKTAQIYAEPGPDRQFMGAFEKSQAAPVKISDKANKLGNSEIAAIREDLALKTKEIKVLKESSTGLVKTKLGEKGLEIETTDGDFKIAIGGRLQLDGQLNQNEHHNHIPQSEKLNDGADLRRGRIHMDGTLYKDYDFKFEYDFVRGSGTNAAGITDAWVEYTGLKPITFTVGQFKEPFSLESVTSNRFLTFIERSAPSNAFVEFANPYLMGISAQTFGDRYTVRGALQAEPIGNGNYSNNTSLNGNGNANRNGQSGNPSYGVTGRATFLPIYNSKTELLHLGAAGSYRTVNNASNGVAAMSFASQVSNVDRSNWANTGGLTDPITVTTNRRVLENFARVGAEVSGVYGPASFQGEYMRTQLSGQNYNSKDHLDGYYAYVSYFLTGESRNYDTKKGAFGRQKPNRNFDLRNGGSGAWELATRFDSLDMNTEHVAGGFLQSGTVALNWYLNPHVRFMADYAHVFTNKTIDTGFTKVKPASATSGQNPDIFMVRAQLDW
ncbi:OprO/OprP family phosphate-selective porin [Candidatus Nitrotoga arctica]|uniref:Phosphate-specific outer membrane porin OprP Pyrophosphate-specific outer membrane porin OprO n=1 Tax=Candidatus Nitrotoga arctica TaxID=453162 RepID=A0ABN8AEX6_9PROT|nr:porin [Candidatus Nitrotoga arctica]CAG9931305.1 Phosphate-specific outer membrane porin OprP; Pyrophosphate-specific outer membrane porin OprO [Candidatus Nitrotoga arctica]